jgi:hypothetical protein
LTNPGTVHIENTSPFTGGTDRTISLVQQSDIDTATSDLVTQFTSDAQAALQQQVRANETIVDSNGIQCTPKSSSDHMANDQVNNFIVKASVTCTAEAYDQQGAATMATGLLQSDALTQLGADYMLVGQVAVATALTGTADNNGTVPINIGTQGLWVFQFSAARLLNLAQIITGKTQTDAASLLLKQKGVSKVIIKTDAGWGNALPTSPTTIKLAVLSVTA